MPIRRKNLRNPRHYLVKYLDRKLPNPVAKKLGRGSPYQQRVVRSSKIYNRNKEKDYGKDQDI